MSAVANVAQLIQQFPQVLADVDALTAKLRAQTEAVKAKDGEVGAANHPGLRQLRSELTKLATNVSDVKQKLAAGLKTARNLRTISQADYDRAKEALRLGGLADFSPAFTRGSWSGSSSGASGGGSSSTLSEGGGGLPMAGLGIVPVIAWGVAIAIAAGVVIAAFVISWSSTSESRARANAIAAQNDAMIAAWQQQVQAQNAPPLGTSGGTPPSFPSAAPRALPPMLAVPGAQNNTVTSIAAGIGSSVGIIALVGLGLWLWSRSRSKRNG